MLKIGQVTLSSPIILGPMAGISSYPYRVINRKIGFELAYLEMLSARALHYLGKRNKEILRGGPDDRPLGVQLLGKDPYYFLKALERLKDYSFDILELNAACPRKKITSNGKGAALLKEPDKLNDLLKTIKDNTSKPLTLKMRLGWDSSKDALRIAKGAQDSGIAAICVHGRTRMQGYRQGVDYKTIAKIKKALKIPVIASGDILNAQLAKKMFDQTGVDAIAIGRGALGNPWIYREIKEFLKKGKIVSRPTIDEIKAVMIEHFNLCVDFYGERGGVVNFRKLYIWYTRGFSAVKDLRTKIARAKTREDMYRLIEMFVKTVKGF